ncbi:MAG: malectin domain-containing carbohydrate-binding protein, partial [Tunicatimonas sp.]|uniref:malectin domain-containing carbohydrate-binding protein n=1 Tax=Tunicatimonas sp. TaxID=1940096 RepID=UPI003C76FD5C
MRRQLLLCLLCLLGWSAYAQSVTSFTLINADTDTDIGSLQNGQTLNLATLPTVNLNVRANTDPAQVGSVRFALNGNTNFQTENVAPYALKGDANGDYRNWTPSVGENTLSATPYTGANASGTVGTALTATFTVIDQADSSPPEPPSSLVATAASPTSISLSWTDNSDDESSFVIEKSPSTAQPFSELTTVTSDTETYTDNSLTDGEFARYRVKAVNGAGSSSFSNTSSATTPYGSPKPPTVIVATVISDTEIYLDWEDAPFGNDYAIERSLSPTSGFEQVDASYFGDSQHTSSGLAPNTTYYFRIKTFFDSEASPYSEVVSATTESAPVSDAILYAINSGGAAYTADDGTEFTADQLVSGGKTYKSNAGISGTTDDFVYQSERYGNFTYQLPVSNGTYEITLLLAEVYFNDPNKRLFDIEIEGNEEVSNLDLYATVGKNVAYQITNTVEVTDGSLSLTFSADINNAKLAGLVVKGSDGVTPPAPPSGVSASALSSTSIEFSWDEYPERVSVYAIEQSIGNPDDFSPRLSQYYGTTSFMFEDLTPGTTYYYRMRVLVDGAYSDYSPVVNATTEAAPGSGEATVSGELRKWHKLTLDFDGPTHSETDTSPNPFLDYRLNVT